MGISEKETPRYNRYIEDIRENSESRYEVSLPFKENHPLIHDHFELSKKINSNEFRFRDAGVLEIKNSSAVNLAKTDFTKQVNLQEVIDIKCFGSFQKLKHVLPWVFRFFNNLKQKILRKLMLLREILDEKEINLSEEMLILDNQNKFETDSQCFSNLKNDLDIIKENDIFKCKSRLENAPIPIEAELPILIYREHYLSKLIIWYIHRKLKHAGTKQTLTELRQKYWVCQSRNYICSIIRKCLSCSKLHCKPYNYPKAPS